ncbi:MAG TPA: hypothetical protein VKD72_18950 [Gemmataceae bacterium]|nr:hypothetical protein [Gemmataceae bacterium]
MTTAKAGTSAVGERSRWGRGKSPQDSTTRSRWARRPAPMRSVARRAALASMSGPASRRRKRLACSKEAQLLPA